MLEKGVASNPKSSKKILEDLSKDIDPNVRIQVALNQKTPIKIIEKLSKDIDLTVRKKYCFY